MAFRHPRGRPAMSHLEHHYIDETPAEARAANTGRVVLYTLLFVTLGLFGIIYLYSLS
jgi:hypothetical protein